MHRSHFLPGSIGEFLANRNPNLPSVLYHYTSASGLVGIVERQEIWATKIEYLNDYQEYRHGLGVAFASVTERETGELDGSVRFALSQMRERLERDIDRGVFVVSFSEDGDLLSQWRAYCPPKGGFSIGFRPDVILAHQSPNQDIALHRCIYGAEEQRQFVDAAVAWCLEPLIARKEKTDEQAKGIAHGCAWTFFKLMVLAAPVLKNPGFAEEREWRLILVNHDSERPSFRVKDSLIVPYIPIPLRSEETPFEVGRVVVGPTADLDLSFESARSFLSGSGVGASCRIAASGVPFKTW